MAEAGTFTAPSSGWALVWRRFRQERLGIAALIGLTVIVLGALTSAMPSKLRVCAFQSSKFGWDTLDRLPSLFN